MSTRRASSFLVLTALSTLPLMAAAWRPVDPADLALKQSKTDPNADSEALFREVRVLNELHGAGPSVNNITEYVRIKIFTTRGAGLGNVQIPYFRDQTLFDVQGRTVHPDGSIVELGKDSIFEKTIERRGPKTKLMTFAMPSVEPGSIIEYRFSINEGERSYRYRALEVQSPFPVDEVTFFIKPLSSPYRSVPAMRFMQFGCEVERGQSTHDGFDVLQVKNVPAFHEEPYSPPEYSSKQWILIYYEENSRTGNDKYWTSLGKDRYKEYSELVKVNGEIKDLAAQITAGAATDDAKLDKILAFCRSEIKDIRGDSITTEELDKAKANRTTLDTIRRKEGRRSDIKYAFLALAEAAGFDARRMDVSDRATFLFGPAMQSAYFLNAFDVAVRIGGKWKFYDVTNNALPGGVLRWQEQGAYALIDDSKDPEMVQTPLLTAKESVRTRYASLTLSDDGTLQGDVREILFGNDNALWREENLHTNDTQREEALRNRLKHRFSDFEVTNIRITANADASKPVGLAYHLVVHGYAQRTGKRLFVQPNFFAAGLPSRFTASDRHNDIYFDYPWSEADSVDLTLPPGFVMDHADAPGGINLPATCTFSVKIGFDNEKNELQYRRQFAFGDKNVLLFEAKNYPAIKKIFDAVHEADNHILTFKTDADALTPTSSTPVQ